MTVRDELEQSSCLGGARECLTKINEFCLLTIPPPGKLSEGVKAIHPGADCTQGGNRMLSFHESSRAINRRAFLRIGGLGLAGLSLADLLRARAAEAKTVVRDRSVIFLFLHGG